MRKLDVKEIQEYLLNIAINVKDILEKYEIPYFITYGTLLGAVRHEGFIPWDDDFDFYLFEDSYDKAIQILRKELPQRFFLEDESSEELYFHGWAHVKDNMTEVDFSLFPQDGIYKNKGLSIDLYKAYLIKDYEEKEFLLKLHKDYLKRKLDKNLISKSFYNSTISKLDSKFNEENHNGVESNEGKLLYTFPSIYSDRIYPEELFPLKRYKFENTFFWGPNNYDKFLRRCYGNYMELPPLEKRHLHYSEVFTKI